MEKSKERLQWRRQSGELKDFIRWRRVDVGIASASELARRVDASTRTITGWESGSTQRIQSRFRDKLADILEVEPSLLLPDEVWKAVYSGQQEPGAQQLLPTQAFEDADDERFTRALIQTFSGSALFEGGQAVNVDVVGFDGDNLRRLIRNCYKNVDERLKQEPSPAHRPVKVSVMLLDTSVERDKFVSRLNQVKPVALQNEWEVEVKVVSEPKRTPSIHGTRVRKGSAVQHVFYGSTKLTKKGLVPTGSGSPYWHFDFTDPRAGTEVGKRVWGFVDELFDGVWRMLDTSPQKDRFRWPEAEGEN